MSRKSFLLLILALSLVLRAVVAIGLHQQLRASGQQFLIAGDAAGYWELGRRLADDGELSIYEPRRHVMRMPGLPFVLAASIRLAGDSLLAARLILAVIGTIGCLCVYWLGRELFDDRVGFVAAALVACWPTLVGFSVLILSETLFAVCLTASLAATARLVRLKTANTPRRVTRTWAFIVGVLVALATYVRPSWILAGPLLAMAIIVGCKPRRQAALEAGCLLIGLGASLLPWGMRNLLVTEHFVVTTLWAGPSLYDGLNPEATGDSNMEFFERDGLADWMSEYELDEYYREAAWQFVKTHPQRTLWLAGQKLVRFWKPWPNAAQFGDWRMRAAVCIPFVLMLGAASFGIWFARPRFWSCILTVGPIIYFTLIHIIFVASLRYRLPAEYPLCVLSAVGIQQLYRVRRRSRDVEC